MLCMSLDMERERATLRPSQTIQWHFVGNLSSVRLHRQRARIDDDDDDDDCGVFSQREIFPTEFSRESEERAFVNVPGWLTAT